MRRAANSRFTRTLSLALLSCGSLLVAWALTGNAAGDDSGSSPTSAATVDSGADAGAPAQPTPIAPGPSGAQTSAAPPATAAPPQSKPAPVSVQVLRAKASATHSVSIVDFAFKPPSITVHTGDTVRWTNTGTAQEGHNVTGDSLDSGTLAPGASFSHTFSGAGTFTYVCTIHPNMKGTVQVLARASSASGGSGGKGGSGGGSSNGSGTSGSGGSGSSATSTPSTSGAGSESAAVSSPDAAGSSGSLPSTGSDSLSLATIGLLLIGLGAALRMVGAARAPRRG